MSQYVCALDISEAFNRLGRHILVKLLTDRGSCQGFSLLCYKTGLIYYVMLVFAGEAVIVLQLVWARETCYHASSVCSEWVDSKINIIRLWLLSLCSLSWLCDVCWWPIIVSSQISAVRHTQRAGIVKYLICPQTQTHCLTDIHAS